MEEICIMWFRQDLRLNDNPALIEANNSGIKILPVYITLAEEMEKFSIEMNNRFYSICIVSSLN